MYAHFKDDGIGTISTKLFNKINLLYNEFVDDLEIMGVFDDMFIGEEISFMSNFVPFNIYEIFCAALLASNLVFNYRC